jgi:hypothetical protein
MARYSLVNDDGEFSADPRDYWYLRPQDAAGGALVREDHPYRTTSGRTVFAPRLLKSEATIRDLERVSPFVRRALAGELPAKAVR